MCLKLGEKKKNPVDIATNIKVPCFCIWPMRKIEICNVCNCLHSDCIYFLFKSIFYLICLFFCGSIENPQHKSIAKDQRKDFGVGCIIKWYKQDIEFLFFVCL